MTPQTQKPNDGHLNVDDQYVQIPKKVYDEMDMKRRSLALQVEYLKAEVKPDDQYIQIPKWVYDEMETACRSLEAELAMCNA